jgi:hypothetical protein
MMTDFKYTFRAFVQLSYAPFLVGILVGLTGVGCGNDECPPSYTQSAAKNSKPGSVSIFIDNSGSMAALFYQNTKMQDFLISNLIAGIEPVTSSWGVAPQCFLISEKVDTIDIGTLRNVIGSKAGIVRRFNGSGTPLDQHLASTLEITGKDGIGIFITDGILCAPSSQLAEYKSRTGKDTYTVDNISEFAALVKKEVGDKFKKSDDFVFRVFQGKTDVEFTKETPYYNYKNVPVSGIRRNNFPYYYFVWGPNDATREFIDKLNKTVGLLNELDGSIGDELNLVKKVEYSMEPVVACSDFEVCGGSDYTWDKETGEKYLEISPVQQKTGIFVNSVFLEQNKSRLKRGEYEIEIEVADAGSQTISKQALSWNDFISVRNTSALEQIIDLGDPCTMSQLDRNNYFFSFQFDNNALSKMTDGDTYTLSLRIKKGASEDVSDAFQSLSNNNDEAGPTEGTTFGLYNLLNALKDVPSYTDWCLLQYSFKFKYVK